jgi:BirA family biotin operon repressor/biotin-[acetyl-CoA-carboxylase] ligase
VILLDSVSSTNDEVRRLAAEGAPEGTVVVADRQSAGRGRLGRRWSSPPGLGLYVSVLFRPREVPEKITRWTVAASIAACEACRHSSGRAVSIEWPNDLVFERRKLGGILAESRVGADGACELVLGSGINVHQRACDFPSKIAGRATSLHLLRGAGMLEREGLAVDYLRRLATVADRLRAREWTSLAARWAELAPAGRGWRVRVLAQSGKPRTGFFGITRGLDEQGALLVERADGRLTAVRTAETVELLGE